MAEGCWSLVQPKLRPQEVVAGSLALQSQIQSCHVHSCSLVGTIHLPGTLAQMGQVDSHC